MTACRDPLPAARWTPRLVLSACLFLNACAVAPPPGDGGEPRVPTVDASVLAAALDAPTATAPPGPAMAPAQTAPAPTPPATPEPAPAPRPVPAAAPTPEQLVMVSAAYVPSGVLPLPPAAHSRPLEAHWLAPLSMEGASIPALRERLVEALQGAGFGERWRLQPLADGEGFVLITAVEQAGGAGARWVARDADPVGAGQRYRSFAFQVGGAEAGIPGRVLVYEAVAPHASLAAFQAPATLTAVDHLRQAGILRTREALVLATVP